MSPSFDYDFPAYSRPASPPSSHIRPNYLTSPAKHHSRPRGPSFASTSSTDSSSLSSPPSRTPAARRRPSALAHSRPPWEREYAYDAADDEDALVDDDDDISFRPPRQPSWGQHLSGYSSQYMYYDSPPRSYEEDSPLRASLLLEAEKPRETDSSNTRVFALALGLRRRRIDDHLTEKPLQHDTQETHAAQEREHDDDDEARIVGANEFTPTCSEAMRRHWQAIALSWRFSVHRTKRRFRNSVGL